ncbi:ATP-binding protein [Paenibacillus melissococcoides]|uniref:ATP-binding protein n=1 Tax=Paenibacillus melissococcoides TaxID=2912268 RepID=A0ABM9G929_9BACL|nr:ATP-binding protein [Paenibacillus melissococcoides]CAH8248469.1 ATP-binding protein [Paenibacillus melissococcoides]CAH8722118.1 ATP-binding protein [Paenibacillus melissococcoides]CAH8722139.1 ATP-binding protein [Paenibacillus melissococcoides]
MMPVSFFEGNRVYDIHGNPYALYIIPNIHYSFLSSVKKTSIINDLEYALNRRADEIHFNLLCRQLSARQISREMREFSEHEGWNEQIQYSVQQLTQIRSFERVNFMAFPLKKREYYKSNQTQFSTTQFSDMIRMLTKELFQRMIQGVVDVKSRLAREEIQLLESELSEHEEQAETLVKHLESSFPGIRPASINEVEWWLKKGYYRGIDDPELKIPYPFPVQVQSKGGRRSIRPIRNTLLTLTEGIIQEGRNHLEIIHPDSSVSYQTFFTTLNAPTDILATYPIGHEWLYGVLEQFDFPIDVSMKVRFEPYIEAREKASRKNKIAKSQVRELKGTETDDAMFGQSEVPDELLDNLEDYDSLRQKFRTKQQSLAYVTTVFAIGAESTEQLEKRVNEFKPRAEEFDHVLVNPTLSMLKMFQSFYPFKDLLPDNWELPMDPGVIAAAVPFGVRTLGDPIGILLGKLLPGRPIFMDPARPMTVLNRSGAILICGTLGSGKTVLLKFLTYNLLLWQAYCFANDPKGDWAFFCEHPFVKPISTLISFTPNSSTLFSPFRLGRSIEECYEAAFGMLELILNPKGQEERNLVLQEAINEVQRRDRWDMFTFAEVLDEFRTTEEDVSLREHADFIFRKLQSLPNHPIARMIFGRDEGKDIFAHKRFVCAITRGLSLPGRGLGKNDWSENERISVAMMYAVATLAIRFLSGLPEGTLKGLAWEEFWYLNMFDRGKQVYNEALRLSRSEKMVVMMASQNPTDINADEKDSDDVTGLFGWKFMLRMESKVQVRYALHNLMDMPDEEPNDWMETFSEEYKNGKGLVRDPEGRIGEVQIEILDPLLLKHCTSTPA